MIKLSDTARNNWYAEEMIDMYGAQGALDRSQGSVYEAVKRVIALRGLNDEPIEEDQDG